MSLKQTLSAVIESTFNLSQHQTTIKKEIAAGITAFLTMAYIIFINPKILAHAGMDPNSVFTATCLVCAISTFLMGIIANNPIAIVPGMALNTFFAYVVVLTNNYNWQNALGMVFISGVIFLALTITKIRDLLIHALPECINIAILAGISLLLGLIALKMNNVIGIDGNIIKLNSLITREHFLFAAGFILILILDYRQVPGTILVGILSISLINFIWLSKGLPKLLSMPVYPSATFMQLQFDQINNSLAYKEVFAFLLIALFDATGTLIGLLQTPLFKKLPNVNRKISRGLICDSIGTILASILGSSSTNPAIESASGIGAGGRTGLTSIVIAILFLLALFISPVVSLIPNFAVGSALLYIACLIMKDITRLDTSDITDFAPAILTMVMIPFSFSIADGIGIGVISYTVLKILTKQWHKLNPTLIVLAVIFLYYFIGI